VPRPPLPSILYVDDDLDLREVVQATLNLISGLDVHTADSGERAIDLAYELRPDLIVMDIMMPGLDGPSTLGRIRQSPLIRDIPVVFLTAKALPAEVAGFLRLGAIGVIAKPFDPLNLGNELIALWKGTEAVPSAANEHNQQLRVADRVHALADGFLQRTRLDLIRLSAILSDPRAGEAALLKEIEQIAHAIRGAAFMFGFPKLGAAGGAIERNVGEIIANSSPSPPMLDAGMRQLRCSTEHLATEFEAAAAMQLTPGAATR
jgi:two-component system, OmpR family, response regulator